MSVDMSTQHLTEREKYKILIFTSSLMDYITRISDFYNRFISKLYIEDGFTKYQALEETEFIYNRSLNLMIEMIYYHRNISLRNEVRDDYVEDVKFLIRKYLVNDDIALKIQHNKELTKSIISYTKAWFEKVFNQRILKHKELVIPPKHNGDFYNNAQLIVKSIYKFSRSLIIHVINADSIYNKMNKLYLDSCFVDMCVVYDFCPLDYLPMDIDFESVKIITLKDIPEFMIEELKKRYKRRKQSV